jgi:predicted nucleic acid-binding protein
MATVITILDAGVIIAAMDATDPHHTRAIQFLRTTSDTLRVHPLNLAEALVGQVRRERGAQALAAIQATGIDALPADTVDALALATVRADTGLKMPDAVALASAMTLDARLATTDARLGHAAHDAGVPTAW